ncbi:SGNH/GDSL hydrolase family protein [Aliidiomarina sp. B3213]|uniref:SGNH/GDSL hydrolase family protein n=1 Tax=Aliidiomarina sp. B3213 TaxID=2249757 RepID=UPI001402BC61|nr:SGNH/GDSL hydrolase family protein [Aliidiomarina sp. B3213]
MRAQTIRLPEASGPREGLRQEQVGEHISVLVIGDSAAAGVGCESQADAVCGQWVKLLEHHHQVHWQLIAKSSLTCSGVLELVKQAQIGPSKPINQVLVSVGVNDVTQRTSLGQWKRNLTDLTEYLTETLAAETIIFSSLPPMQHFPALPQPLRWFVGLQAKRLNKALKRHCEAHHRCIYLPLNIPFESKYMAEDGFHPSKHAATLWAANAFQAVNLNKG